MGTAIIDFTYTIQSGPLKERCAAIGVMAMVRSNAADRWDLDENRLNRQLNHSVECNRSCCTEQGPGFVRAFLCGVSGK